MFQEKYFDSLTNCILHFSFLLLRKYPRHPRHPRQDCSLPIVYIYTIDTVVATLDTVNSYGIPLPHRDVRKTCTCAHLGDLKKNTEFFTTVFKQVLCMQQVPLLTSTMHCMHDSQPAGRPAAASQRTDCASPAGLHSNKCRPVAPPPQQQHHTTNTSCHY